MEKLKPDMIAFVNNATDWKDAIRISSQKLYDNGMINQNYINKMIQNVEEFGPYIVIAPNIAMPHSRPEHGVIEGGFSITVFEESVDVVGNEAKVFITLACSHDTEHLEMLQLIATKLNDDDVINNFVNAKTECEIMNIFGGNNE